MSVFSFLKKRALMMHFIFIVKQQHKIDQQSIKNVVFTYHFEIFLPGKIVETTFEEK